MVIRGVALAESIRCEILSDDLGSIAHYKMAKWMPLKPSDLLVHEANRGSLGVNPYDSHLLGVKIKGVGADEGELKYCVCFELKKHAEKKEQNSLLSTRTSFPRAKVCWLQS